MRYLFGFMCVLALGLMGCGETAGTGGFPCTEQGIRDAIAEGGGPHTFACNGPTTVVTEAEIVINNDVILDGEGNLAVDGGEGRVHRVFSVAEGITAELRGFTVTKGFVGGIQNFGTLTVTNSTVSGNTADSGGGIFDYGTLTLTNSTVSGNTASYNHGGGIFSSGTLTVTNSTVSGNSASDGGGIWNDFSATLTLTNSTVLGNSASDGGDIVNHSDATLTLTSSIVDGNCVNSAPSSSCGASPVLSGSFSKRTQSIARIPTFPYLAAGRLKVACDLVSGSFGIRKEFCRSSAFESRPPR
jgi:hypothetical protein